MQCTTTDHIYPSDSLGFVAFCFAEISILLCRMSSCGDGDVGRSCEQDSHLRSCWRSNSDWTAPQSLPKSHSRALWDIGASTLMWLTPSFTLFLIGLSFDCLVNSKPHVGYKHFSEAIRSTVALHVIRSGKLVQVRVLAPSGLLKFGHWECGLKVMSKGSWHLAHLMNSLCHLTEEHEWPWGHSRCRSQLIFSDLITWIRLICPWDLVLCIFWSAWRLWCSQCRWWF